VLGWGERGKEGRRGGEEGRGGEGVWQIK